jgi:hypothetical protein
MEWLALMLWELLIETRNKHKTVIDVVVEEASFTESYSYKFKEILMPLYWVTYSIEV